MALNGPYMILNGLKMSDVVKPGMFNLRLDSVGGAQRQNEDDPVDLHRSLPLL